MGQKMQEIQESIHEIMKKIKLSDRESVIEKFVEEVQNYPLIMEYLYHHRQDLNFAIGEGLKDPWTQWKKKVGVEEASAFEDMTFSTAQSLRPVLQSKTPSKAPASVTAEVIKVLNGIDPQGFKTTTEAISKAFLENKDIREHLEKRWAGLYEACQDQFWDALNGWVEKHDLTCSEMCDTSFKGEDDYAGLFLQIYRKIENELG